VRRVRATCASRDRAERPSLHGEEIQIPVVVVVEERPAGPYHFGEKQFTSGPVDMGEVDAGFNGYVNKDVDGFLGSASERRRQQQVQDEAENVFRLPTRRPSRLHVGILMLRSTLRTLHFHWVAGSGRCTGSSLVHGVRQGRPSS